MKNLRWFQFWARWGLVSRLMFAVGLAIVAGGGIQTYLFVAEGAAEHSARLKRDMGDVLAFLSPLVADQAILGEYEAINQLLKNQVKRGEVDRFEWTDQTGKKIVAQDVPDKDDAPGWFRAIAQIDQAEADHAVQAGGVGYGTLRGSMTPVKAGNRLWGQFVKQLQIVVVTLFLMLQFIWLIFRGNLGTLRMLAEGANRFSQGDHAVRIDSEGAPEVRLAADAFNNMADNIENLLSSLGKSESKNKLLATIVEQSSEAIWTRDLISTVTSWNSGAVAMFGYPAGEAVGSRIRISLSESDAEEEGRMSRLQRGERFSYETKASTRSSGEVHIQVAVAPLIDESNQCVGTISVAHDITERKRNEEELRLAREVAESANQAKSSFLAKMSHEIRTPMNGVLGMTELLLETELTDRQRKYADTVQRSGKNLLGIINDILDFSKIEAGKLELEHIDMDLRRTVEDVAGLLSEHAQNKGVELACNISPGVTGRVKGDPLRLGQILTNLLGNAIKFTERGRVVISVIPVEETAHDVTLRFEVRDSGAGIRPEALGRIFDTFSQADGSTTRKHGGTGLGLAISKQLVEMMGGKIQVESTPGAGSTFWFTCRFEKQATQSLAASLPEGELDGMRAPVGQAGVQPSAAIRGIHAPGDAAPPRGRGNLLLAEDNPINQTVALRMLEIEGYRVTAVNNGREALDAHAQGSFDLVLMDCQMPEMDGYEATRKIRASERQSNKKRIPIVAVTANALSQDREKCLDAGMDDYLSKPYTRQQMREVLNRWVAGTAPAQAPAGESAGAAPAAQAPAAQILDRNALDALRALQTKDKPDLLERVINLYLTESPKLVQRLKQAAEANDMAEIARTAHTLRSSSAHFGATELARLCQDLEASAKRAAAEEAGKLLAALEVEYRSVQAALTAELDAKAA